MKALSSFLVVSLTTLTVLNADAASFDCDQAKTPIEKLICKDPALDDADSTMGEVFQRVNKSFPVKGFVMQTQKDFVRGLPYCLQDSNGKRLSEKAAAPRCLERIEGRIAELERYERSRVYGNTKDTFDPEGIIFWVYEHGGTITLYAWGNWMPDGHDPKPYPHGALCEFEADLIPVSGGFKIAEDSDSVIAISDSQLSFSEYVACSPRVDGFNGGYPRVGGAPNAPSIQWKSQRLTR